MATFASDVLIYGGTMPGIVAAVRAARMGRTVRLIEWTPFTGGLVTGGLGFTDFVGASASRTDWGITTEFFEYVEDAAIAAGAVEDTGLLDAQGVPIGYGRHPNGLIRRHVPSWARAARDRLLATVAGQVTVTKDIELVAVDKDRDSKRISAVTLANGDVYEASQFGDASYEADLLRLAGVPITYGREGVSTYGEYNAGYGPHLQFLNTARVVSERGDTWKYFTHPAYGAVGEADFKAQADNFRMTLSTESNRRAFPPPPGYRPEDFKSWIDECNVRNLDNIENFTSYSSCTEFLHTTNGNDLPGESWTYPRVRSKAGRLARQALMFYRHAGMYFTAQNNPAVPLALRNSVAAHGLPANENTLEFIGAPGWSSARYVRAPQRMKGQQILTFNDMVSPRRFSQPDPICMGGYNLDRHAVNLSPSPTGGRITEGHLEDEGRSYYQITFRSVKPHLQHCSNLLAIIGNSASEPFQASQRMEPTWMVQGDGCGMALARAEELGVPVGQLSYDQLRPLLDAAGARLTPP